MKIDEKAVRHLEALARIELTDDERSKLVEQLDEIVVYVEQLQGVDTTGVEPTSAVIQQEQTQLRPDEVIPGLDRDVILEEAPDKDNGYFRVPKVIDRD